MSEKVKVKDSASRTVDGYLNLHDSIDGGINLEVIGMDEPQNLKDLFKEYDGRFVTIRMGYNEQLTSEEVEGSVE